MSVRLATHLLQERLIPPQRIDDLLQLQVVTGGALDTLLLEAKLLDETHLLAAMSECFKLPAAGKEEIDETPTRLTEIFPRAFAETYRMIPYRMVDRNLLVLVAEPPNPNIVRTLETRLRIFIHPAITTEARLLYALHKMYSVALGERFTELLRRLDPVADEQSFARAVPELTAEAPVLTSSATPAAPAEPTNREPTANEATNREPTTSETATSHQAAPAASGSVASSGFVATGSLPVATTAPIDLDTALRRLQLGQSRDQLIDVLLAFTNQTFQFAGLLIAVEGRLLGFRGRGDANAEYRISQLRVPLNVGSMFRTAAETRAPYLGQVPATGINKDVMLELGRPEPKTLLLVPFLIGERVAGVLYADNGRRGVPSKRVADILVVTTQLGRHFERLIQRKKTEVRAALQTDGDAPMDAPEPMPQPPLETVEPAPAPLSTESLTFSALSAEAARIDEGVDSLAPILPAPTPALVFEGEAEDESSVAQSTAASPVVAEPARQEAPVYAPSAMLFSPGLSAEFEAPEVAPLEASVPAAAEPMAAAPIVDAPAGPPALTPAEEAKARLAERMKNILAAASEDDEEEDESQGEEQEEAIALDDTSADAVLAEKSAEPIPLTKTAQKPAPAFSEIDEHDAEENLAGWESVLVDTISQGRQGGTQPAADSAPEVLAEPPKEVSWDEVIVEAAQSLTSPAPAPQLVVDETAVLLDALDGPDLDAAARAAEALWNQHREGLADKLGPRFPGRLAIDPFATGTVLPSIGDVSLVLRLLAALGQDAVAVVVPHLDSPYPVHRLLATLYFGQIVSGKAFSKLLRRLFDEEPRVRDVAAEVLRKYKAVPGFDEGVQRIRDRLSLPVIDAQVRATEILGRLRDGKSVPLLIPLTAAKRPELANATLGALMRLTAQDFGHNPKKWTEWWVKNSARAREQWLIDGLRRKEPILKVIADEELRRATGLTFGFRIDSDKKAQEQAIVGWESWWESEQRLRTKRAGS